MGTPSFLEDTSVSVKTAQGRYANDCSNPREVIILKKDGTAIAKYKNQVKTFSWQQKGSEVIFTHSDQGHVVSRIDEHGNLNLYQHPRAKGHFIPPKDLIRYKCL
ncbi:MAG: hypothetical protein ACK5MJ_06875 [Alphaproteobacteria bacterium]